jgi:hypothetical protein
MPEDATPELHIPLTPTPGIAEDEYRFPWIHEVEESIAALEDADVLVVEDDAEEVEGDYVFYLGGASEERLIAAASRLADQDRVPAGAFAIVDGRRLELND